jgi:putative ABC transport system ATP-binding protein
MPDSAGSETNSLVLAGVTLSYPLAGGDRLEVLDIPDWRIAGGRMTGITGGSGSGKSSLLHLLAGIERPVTGTVGWGGVIVSALAESARDRWRRTTVGLVFQDFHLVPGLSIEANVLLPWWTDHWSIPVAAKSRALELIATVGLGDPRRAIDLLSRGEKQRVAIARALVRRPRILLADEPTASLDPRSGENVAGLLTEIAQSEGMTLIVASHDPALLGRMQRTWRLAAGRLESVP